MGEVQTKSDNKVHAIYDIFSGFITFKVISTEFNKNLTTAATTAGIQITYEGTPTHPTITINTNHPNYGTFITNLQTIYKFVPDSKGGRRRTRRRSAKRRRTHRRSSHRNRRR